MSVLELTDLGEQEDVQKEAAARGEEKQEEEKEANGSVDTNSCGSGSACTVLPSVLQPSRLTTSSSEGDLAEGGQILSIRRLQFASESQARISLKSHNESSFEEINLNASDSRPSGNTMFSTTSQQQLANGSIHQARGFSEAAPKICVASRRVKEYFESMKSHSGETAHLYQFFKSTRTELVACLLFALISSQVLLVCRTHLPASFSPSDGGGGGGEKPPMKEPSGGSIGELKMPASNQLAVHLASGLSSAFTVASLTQIFGHISGCHLIPSVSLALYVKGHISRLRLASYLVAQSAGSLLGVSLLGLLTTSQMSLDEYRELLVSRSQTRYARLNRRRRREVEGDRSEDINLNDIQGSETILLSIAEQQQQLRQDKRLLGQQEQTIITNASTYRVAASQPANRSDGSQMDDLREPDESRQQARVDDISRAPSQGGIGADANDKSRVVVLLPASNDVGRIPQEQLLSRQDPLGKTGARVKLRRKKRNRRQQASADIYPPMSNNSSSSSKRYINMLQFTLPDSIMSSDSVRQCVADESPSANCLSLSNSSQMFVFQLLATLLVVLTYLVNVEPRRVDLGFKSLSIGLSYFVAHVLTVHSGGFYGNPSQLVYLTWLSPVGEWQGEWIVYLIAPLIGGLLGAISHEYIDYNSPARRNKSLHLRRSFYSLDKLHQQQPANVKAQEIATLSQQRGRRPSESSSDSNSNSNSVLTLAGDPPNRQQPPHVIESRGTERKLISYSRQVRMEQLKQLEASSAELACQQRRRSDFDSNFLISSSPQANARKVHNGFM